VDDILKRDIKEILPHREPFIFIDKVLEVKDGFVVASKVIKVDEDYFRGHFPGQPFMPGVLIVECMAQTGGIACSTLNSNMKGGIFFLSRICDVKFLQSVMPDSTITMRAQVIEKYPPFYKVDVTGEVDGKIVARGEIVLTKQEGRRV